MLTFYIMTPTNEYEERELISIILSGLKFYDKMRCF